MMKKPNAQKFDNQFRLLRAWISTQISAPFIAVLASRPDDGKAYVVHGLAEAYANAGFRTAFVDVSSDTITLQPVIGEKMAVSAITSFESATLVHDAHSNIHVFDEVVSDWRRRFDAVIVRLGADILADSSLRFLSVVDGVIIARENGRAQHDSDTVLVEAVHRIGRKILAVVPTGRVARDFRPDRAYVASADQGDRVTNGRTTASTIL